MRDFIRGGMIFAGAYAVFYGIFSALDYVRRNPIKCFVTFAVVYATATIIDVAGFAYYDTPAMIRATEAEAREVMGNPEACSNSGDIICDYEYGKSQIVFRGGRSISVTSQMLRGEDFSNTEAYYRDVAKHLHFDYRAPTYATIDEIRWDIPGMIVRVQSDQQLRVSRVLIDAA